MLGNKEYTGIVFEGGTLKIARVKPEGGKLRLLKLDQVSLISDIDSEEEQETDVFAESSEGEETDPGEVFGLEEEEEDQSEEDISDEIDEELSFEDLEGEETEEEEDMDLDMVDEAETEQSNELLLYNLLDEIDPKRVNIGINIPAGDTIYQIIKDTNFKEVKKKDLVADLEKKLESIYGSPKTTDNYSYKVRDDGTLVLASIDKTPSMLRLVDQTLDLYSGKLVVEDILPDELILVGMARANYDLPEVEVTGLLQFGPKKCRIVFMQGNEIMKISPIINEGTRNKGFLNTVFSKILFQLDTGDVPNLDRIIIANNTLGEEAIDFFKQNFPDMSVDEFEFDDEKLDYEGHDEETIKRFTNAIGMAWAAAGYENEYFPELSFLPEYVEDRQKIFKLQWHGVVLLFLIFLTPVAFNYFYQQNVQRIETLSSEVNRIDAQLQQITPTVNSTNELKDNLTLIREKLVLLDTLTQGTREWTTKLNILNEGMREVRGSWLTAFNFSDEGIFLDGYTLYRNRIPHIINIFSDATLLNVNIAEIREQEVYRFSILVKEFTDDKERYSPDKPEEIQQILNNTGN